MTCLLTSIVTARSLSGDVGAQVVAATTIGDVRRRATAVTDNLFAMTR